MMRTCTYINQIKKVKANMKQTAIKISMISNIDNVVNDNTNNGEQLMTSLEVAQLTGKKHKSNGKNE